MMSGTGNQQIAMIPPFFTSPSPLNLLLFLLLLQLLVGVLIYCIFSGEERVCEGVSGVWLGGEEGGIIYGWQWAFKVLYPMHSFKTREWGERFKYSLPYA